MKIYNTKNKSDFENSINQIANKLEIEIDYNSISGNCYRVKLNKKKENKNYQRKGFYNNKNGTPRKVNAICWHGFRDFLTELYKVYSDLRVFTAQITYNNKQDFELKYPDTANINIGSMVQPLNYEDACFCNKLKVVSVSCKEIAENNYNLSPSYWINKKSAIN
jgi:hypothetical protein